MNLLHSRKIKSLIISFLFVFVLVFSPISIISYYRINRKNHENVKTNNYNIFNPKDLLNLEDLNPDNRDKDEIYDWNKLIVRSDQNKNGISDRLEQKLNLLQSDIEIKENNQFITTESVQEILQKNS